MILLARLIVLVVLAYSGLAKLGSARVRVAASDLGLSAGIAKGVGRFLAPTELLVAGLLCFSLTAYAGAVAALALFIAFTALIAWNLWQGKKPACACFGEASEDPISNWTLGRDLFLVALAAAVVAAGPAASAQGIVGGLAFAIRSAGVAASLAVMGLLQGGILLTFWARRSATAGTPSSGPTASPALAAKSEVVGWTPGTLAPAFDLPSLEGARVTLQDLVANDRHAILIFTSPDCRHCQALFPEITQWQEADPGVLSLALLTRGAAADNREKVEEFGIRNVLLQGGSEVAEAYQATATPTAVVVDPARRIASRVAAGAVAIRQLVEAWTERSKRNAPGSVLSPPPPEDPTRLLAGEPAPPFKLPSLRGGDVDLLELAGRITVLVFWSPTCRFCSAFAPELREREKTQTESSAQMVFVSAGTKAANEADTFVSPVLLDQEGTVARAYGSKGTPGAVLVDAESNVASAMASGQGEIEALLQRADMMARAARRVVA